MDNRTTASAVGAVIRRLGHSAAAAITEAELEAFEKDAIKKRVGKKAGGRVRRQKLTSATVGDGKMLRQLEAAAQAKDDERVEERYAVSRAGGVPGNKAGGGRVVVARLGGVGAHVRQKYWEHRKLR